MVNDGYLLEIEQLVCDKNIAERMANIPTGIALNADLCYAT
jgi:hypothetical protein